jgi:hypothetical protein
MRLLLEFTGSKKSQEYGNAKTLPIRKNLASLHAILLPRGRLESAPVKPELATKERRRMVRAKVRCRSSGGAVSIVQPWSGKLLKLTSSV